MLVFFVDIWNIMSVDIFPLNIVGGIERMLIMVYETVRE